MSSVNNAPVLGYRATDLAAGTRVEIRFDAAAWAAESFQRYGNGKATLVRRIMAAKAAQADRDGVPDFTAAVELAGGTVVPLGLDRIDKDD
ncbi:hypothetical protein ACT3SZ_14840 [Corynebacterium sp. AOP40-9SA-29]|uniref:hypothetical protein n=1 Tax=Corynebacterium sp. AOP40-9SA-29 TaxID=3457677 RepID=UPI004033B927